MVCIYCKSETRVINSRLQKRTNTTWRRRRCTRCRSVFTSQEAVDLSGSVAVKKGNNIEPFSRDKLLLSIYDSLRHRKTAISDAEGLTDTVLSKLYAKMDVASIERVEIITATGAALKRFDKAAYTHYTAFHPVNS